MTTDFKSIPLIDISPLVEKWDDPNSARDERVVEVVRQLDNACREAGFFYVTGHGIPDSLVKEIRIISRQFFDLPFDEKHKINLSAAAGYRGYQRVGVNVTKGLLDLHEAIDCYREVKPGMYGALGEVMEGCNQWPSDPPHFKNLMEDYVNRCTGLLTLLNQDDHITALQVRNIDGEWISAAPVPGTFVCNIGDMLKTNYDAAVEPLDICVQKSGGAKKFNGAVYGKHLVGKVLNNFIF
ncbi:hypothetical protein C2S52_009299 [Perilla frutescens var. hirtella]|uniref:Non-haem dioxygenase N-terminal domain-containing protein n=1 Tax=Perilla frutescens var. hirtella TaxID=608512 RepID=A0AAD4IXU5_PERFH|nr:hypothetical protein C2S51_017202 [Perilla frutescens var. frutescens]KAH6784340.1 hypothetical protein C2S52_009299 [Perilla frutescens var. hirtella]KAH6823279.1 hypothetical protein C2S53_015020 [Perilla frutescens var. hirtella]